MGLFSFTLGDEDGSVWINEGPIYAYLPDGRVLCELNYNGYGDFQSEDIFDIYVDINIPDANFENIKKRDVGILLQLGGGFYIDVESNRIYSRMPNRINSEIIGFRFYTDIIDELGFTPNELIESEKWKEISLSDILNIEVKHPRFSYNKNTSYDELLDAKPCPNQGFKPLS